MSRFCPKKIVLLLALMLSVGVLAGGAFLLQTQQTFAQTLSDYQTNFICPIDNQPAAQADSSLLGIPLNQYAAPFKGEGPFDQPSLEIVRKLGGANVHFARHGLHWQVLERDQLPAWCNSEGTAYCWGMYDQMIKDLIDAGLEPVITLGGVPEKYSSAPPVDADEDGHKDDFADYPPSDIEDWKNFVGALVSRYGCGQNGNCQVKNWEIWNEPDIDEFFKGTPEQYFELLNSAYDTIKQVDLSAKVWGPTTLYFLEDIDWTPDKRKFPFSDLAIREGKMDVFSVHVYADLEESYRRIVQLRQRLDNTPDKKDMPIAITETNEWIPPHDGTTICYDGVSDEQQAKMLTERYYCLSNAGAQSVFWWKPTDSEDNRCADGLQRDGLFKMDLSEKPSYFALRAIGEYLDEDACAGTTDLNCDGAANLVDLLQWRALFVQGNIEADVNEDGLRNLLDYLMVLREWFRG